MKRNNFGEFIENVGFESSNSDFLIERSEAMIEIFWKRNGKYKTSKC